MAVLYSKNGDMTIIPTNKKTYQGNSKNTKYSPRGRRPRRKAPRGQG